MRSILIAAVALCLPVSAQAQSVSKTRSAPAVSSGFVLKAGTAVLAGMNVTTGAAAGYVMVFDAATVPADGAVTPLRCLPVAANTGVDINFRGSPLKFDTGAVIAFSTTGCYTKTSSATAFIAGDIQ
jgi:hypothetical protein